MIFIRQFISLTNSRTVNHLPGSHLSLCRRPFSRCILSSSCTRKAGAILGFHSRLSPLVDLFGRWGPALQNLPYHLSFLLHQLVPGAQSFLCNTGFLWLHHVHHDQVPRGNLACHAYRECHLFPVVHRNTLRPVSEERIITVSSVKMQQSNRK